VPAKAVTVIVAGRWVSLKNEKIEKLKTDPKFKRAIFHD
jgi:hypothetical protein